MEQSQLEQVRELWRTIASAPGAFASDDSVHITSRGQYGLCPDDWIGVVTIGSSALVEYPEHHREKLDLLLAANPPPSELATNQRLLPQW